MPVLLLSNLDVPGMFMDGVIYAVLGKNFALQGGWPVPRFTDYIEPEFFDHPPYFFYFESLFFKLFGINWASARASGVFFSILTVLGLYWGVGKITENKRKAFLSGIVLLLFLPFLKKSRFPNMDLPLSFFILSSAFLVTFFRNQ